MAENRDLIFELGTEELPPKSLLLLRNALHEQIVAGLLRADLKHGDTESFATPRRLAVLIRDLDSRQPDKSIEKRGPAIKAAFKEDGSPTKAAEGFARSYDVPFDQLGTLKTEKGEWLCFKQQIPGSDTTKLIPGIINEALSALPIARRMRWGSNTIEFVRPVHWVLLVFGEEKVSAEILGVDAGPYSYGHRFHRPDSIRIDTASGYRESLRTEGHVIVDFEERKELVYREANQAATVVSGEAYIELDLLDEVTSLLEWPVSVTGAIEKRFLELPTEVLITTMQSNQKYFPVKDLKGNLLPFFIAFSNIESRNPGSVKLGNERVIRPRLADAEFFWKQDRKESLESRVVMLPGIVFQKKLGTLADKTHRVQKLAGRIAEILNIQPTYATHAALLAKTDLLTEMVGEFPGLQGVMGRYYALADGENEEVAAALEEQYLPRQAGGQLPETETGRILALAEKIDTVVGIFSAGLIPTGDKDPYALRRAALGVLRIIIEKDLDLDLSQVIEFSAGLFSHDFDRTSLKSKVFDFFVDRLKGYCLEKGYQPDEFEAVVSVIPTKPRDFEMRLRAVREFRLLPEASSLASANKRIRNILRKAKVDSHSRLDQGLLVEAQERSLFEASEEANRSIEPLLSELDYTAALTRLARLRDSVDGFFDHVMVMAEDPQLQRNRLALLKIIEAMFMQIADISKLQ